MKVSLVLATVNRTGEVKRLLASLAVQTYREFELIVVDQNPDDRLVPILAEYETQIAIRHLRLGTKGVSRARNVGMDTAEGEIIGFPDDDCEYPLRLLENVVAFFGNDPAMDALTGRSIDWSGNISNGKFDKKSGPVTGSAVWGQGIEYTIFLRTSSVGGRRFDEDLGVGAGTAWVSGEGTDLLLGMLESGYRIHYDTSIEVMHRSSMEVSDDITIRKAYGYACGMGRVLKKRRSPLKLKARYLVRPAGGALLYALRLDPNTARKHINVFLGRLRGMTS